MCDFMEQNHGVMHHIILTDDDRKNEQVIYRDLPCSGSSNRFDTEVDRKRTKDKRLNL